MKKHTIIFISMLLAISMKVYSQSSFIIVADSTNSKDSDISYIYPDKNFGKLNRFRTDAWTYNGSLEIVRAAIYFDLSVFCLTSKILEARLSLYHDDDFDHSTRSGSNSSYLKRIIQNWHEDSITWNNQPEVTDINRVILESSDSVDQNYLHIDVTRLVQDMVANPNSSYGFLLQLVNESPYRRMNFASSEHEEYIKRPRLTILYDNCYIGCVDTITIYDTVTIKDFVAVEDTLIIDIKYNGLPEIVINRIKVYPNPTRDIINIENSNYTEKCDYEIKIVNANSQIVFESNFDQEKLQVSISDLGSSGLYLLQIFDIDSNLIGVRKILLK